MAKIVLGIGTSHTPAAVAATRDVADSTPRATSATPSSRIRPTAT